MLTKITVLKLIIYLVVSILSLFSNNFDLNSKVIYTVLDSTLAGRDFMDAKQYYIDFNGDGTDEFFLSHANQGMDEISYVCEIYSGTNQNNNEVLVFNNNRIPVMLGEGEVIDANLTGWYNSYNGMSTMAMYFEEDWVGSGFHFAGLRFKINNKYHYGWVRVSIPSNSSNIVVKDMAYDDSPETAIIVGEPSLVVTENFAEKNPEIKIIGNSLIIETDSNYKCEIYNLIGNKLKDIELNNQTNIINLDGFNFGIYLLNIKSSNKILAKKFVINR